MLAMSLAVISAWMSRRSRVVVEVVMSVSVIGWPRPAAVAVSMPDGGDGARRERNRAPANQLAFFLKGGRGGPGTARGRGRSPCSDRAPAHGRHHHETALRVCRGRGVMARSTEPRSTFHADFHSLVRKSGSSHHASTLNEISLLVSRESAVRITEWASAYFRKSGVII